MLGYLSLALSKEIGENTHMDLPSQTQSKLNPYIDEITKAGAAQSNNVGGEEDFSEMLEELALENISESEFNEEDLKDLSDPDADFDLDGDFDQSIDEFTRSHKTNKERGGSGGGNKRDQRRKKERLARSKRLGSSSAARTADHSPEASFEDMEEDEEDRLHEAGANNDFEDWDKWLNSSSKIKPPRPIQKVTKLADDTSLDSETMARFVPNGPEHVHFWKGYKWQASEVDTLKYKNAPNGFYLTYGSQKQDNNIVKDILGKYQNELKAAA